MTWVPSGSSCALICDSPVEATTSTPASIAVRATAWRS